MNYRNEVYYYTSCGELKNKMKGELCITNVGVRYSRLFKQADINPRLDINEKSNLKIVFQKILTEDRTF